MNASQMFEFQNANDSTSQKLNQLSPVTRYGEDVKQQVSQVSQVFHACLVLIVEMYLEQSLSFTIIQPFFFMSSP